MPALAGVVMAAIAVTPPSSGASTAGAARDPGAALAPERAAFTYRFAIEPRGDDSAAAIAMLEQRVDGAQASPIDLTELAGLYLARATDRGSTDDFDRAEAIARRSIEILPTPNAAHVTLAKLANARHRFREAVQICRAQLAHTRSTALLNTLATAHLALGELTEAAAAAEASVALKPIAPSYLLRALVMQAQGRNAEAAFDFARAAAVEDFGDPAEAARLRTLWGRFLMKQGQLSAAGQLFEEALRIVPHAPLALANQAEARLRSGDLAGAKHGFDAAFAASRQVRYLIDLARAQDLSGDRAGADSTRTQAEKLIRADLASHGFGHQLELVEILVDRGRPGDLREAISLARDETARRPSADTRFQLARALARAGVRAEAAEQIGLALASGVRDARTYELAARVESGPRAELYARQARALDLGASRWRAYALDPVAASP